MFFGSSIFSSLSSGLASYQGASSQESTVSDSLISRVANYCSSFVSSTTEPIVLPQKEQLLPDYAVVDVISCVKEMGKPGDILFFADQLSDERGYFLKPENKQPMEQILVGNICFQEIEATDEIAPKLRVYDKNNPELEIFFSNRSCTNGEMRGKLLRQELEKLQATEPLLSLKEGLEKICNTFQPRQVKIYALKPLKAEESLDFSAIEKTVDDLFELSRSEVALSAELVQRLYVKNLKIGDL
jgi:hypothetical protein